MSNQPTITTPYHAGDLFAPSREEFQQIRHLLADLQFQLRLMTQEVVKPVLDGNELKELVLGATASLADVDDAIAKLADDGDVDGREVQFRQRVARDSGYRECLTRMVDGALATAVTDV